MNEVRERYFSEINELYELVQFILSGVERKIIENKIEEIELLTKYLLGGEDNDI